MVEFAILRCMSAYITQDKHRERALVETANLPPTAPVFVVPNSHRGKALRRESRYYHDKFGLPPERPLVLMAGAVQTAWAHTKFVAECAASQGELPKYTLVIQSRERLSEREVRELKHLEGENVRLSLEPVPFADLSTAGISA